MSTDCEMEVELSEAMGRRGLRKECSRGQRQEVIRNEGTDK